MTARGAKSGIVWTPEMRQAARERALARLAAKNAVPAAGASKPGEMSDEEAVAILKGLEAEQYLLTYERNKFFTPYPTQLEFIAASKTKFELLLSAGNGTGKTEGGAYIMAMHATGEYPDWWPGRRWRKPIDAWICGRTSEAVREAAQFKLVGRLDEDRWGTGMIPKRLLGKREKTRGTADTIDTLQVKHTSGGWSNLAFKTYAQEPGDWQGPRLDLIWFDEEPTTVKHYTEGLARLMGRNGLSYMTFTPLAGPTEVVKRFIDSDEPTRGRFEMSMDEAKHISDEEKARKYREYPHYERAARYHGQISLGEGAVWTVPDQDLIVDMALSQVPAEWPKLWGIDFGINHPFAATLYALDRETDTHYVLAEIRMKDAIPLQHASAMKEIAANVPVAWPKDGLNREKSSGEPLAQAYRKLGLQMLREPATFPTGGNSLYAGVTEMGILMQARKWKVERRCAQWLSEYRMYHFRDGKIVPMDEDLLSASRYAYMMRRRGQPVKLSNRVGRRGAMRPRQAPRINPWTGRAEAVVQQQRTW